MIFRASVLRSMPVRTGAVTRHQVVAQAGPVVLHLQTDTAPPAGVVVDFDLTETNGVVSAVAGWSHT